MRKWMSATLALVFVFTLAFSFALTVTTNNATAETLCCDHHFCIETQTWAIGIWEWDPEFGNRCVMNGDLRCQVECEQGP